MESVIEKIYEEIFKDIDKYVDSKRCVDKDSETSKLLMQFKEVLPTNLWDLFDKLWRSVLSGDYDMGVEQFKGGFKMGFQLACECLKG